MGYERAAPYYDLFGAKDDGAFLAALLSRTGGPALVVGAGTAREALPLAAAGEEVVAVDRSEAMLAVAADKTAARRLGGRLRLLRADARDFSLRRRFPLVVALNLFAHFVEEGEASAALRNFRVHLAPGGRLLLNVETPAWRPPDPPVEESRELGDGRRLRRTVKYRPTRRPHVYAIELWFDVLHGDLLLDRILERDEVRLFRPDEVRQLAATAGLRVDEVYADFASAPLQDSSPEAVFVFK
ncbi:MAG: class I SAM-dependent methyltransferase [Candidatus Coatesbacteria bacterium]|nr:MAG: class I SAM-dependent methyltransferase [Candidatus Coatesbacteria bacterium]